ncbi:MAG: hypothetical protein JRF50_16880, partial [Deltaproteobacteria bacterium]|nr:hypothetical protein [Deltaproteobacteria bacterium]
VGLLPLAIFYFLDSVQEGKTLFGFLGFLFSLNYLLHMGFYNFCLSASLYFFTIGYWWKHKEELSIANIAVLSLLFVMTYLSHLVSYLLLLLTLTFLSFTSLRKPKALLRFLGYMSLPYFIFLNYFLGRFRGCPHRHWSWAQKLDFFINTKSLVYFTDTHLIVTHILWVFIALAFFLTIWNRVRQRRWITEKDPFLLLALLSSALYFISPREIGTGGWINDRLGLFPLLLLLPWFSTEYHRYLKDGIIVGIVLLSLMQLSFTIRDYYLLNKEITEFTSGVGFVEENKVVSTVGNLYGGQFKYAYPLGHAGGYYGINNGCVHLENYEARKGWDYFPVDFRENRPGRIDYIVAWRMSDDQLKQFEWGMKLIHQTPNLKLYRVKPFSTTHSFFVENLSEARVWNNFGDTFQWKSICSDNIVGDHFVREGWEGTSTRSFIAHTLAMLRGEPQEGLLMLANPDDVVLSVEWSVDAPEDSVFQIRYALTDAAVEKTKNGLELRVFTIRNDGTRQVLLKDKIESGDVTVRERTFTFDTDISAIRVTHDNLGSEYWDVLYIDPRLELAK